MIGRTASLTSACFVIGVLILILGLNTSAGDTIIVDDDGGAWADYDNIQDAVNNSVNGDRILVFAGMYEEEVVLNETVSLVGNGTGITIVEGDGHGDVILVEADNVTITNITIRGAERGSGHYNDAFIKLYRIEHTLISDCEIINGSGCGIVFDDSENCTVRRSVLHEIGPGIRIDRYSYRNVIEDTHLYDDGITIDGKRNIVQNCTINDSSHGILIGSTNNLVQDCILNNSGIDISDARNTISNCTIRDAMITITGYGGPSSRKSNSILNCTVSNPESDVIQMNATNTTIVNCTLDGGIFMWSWNMYGLEYSESQEPYDSHTILNCTTWDRPLCYIKNTTDISVESNAGQIIIANASDVSIQDVNLSNVRYGILIAFSKNVTLNRSKLSETAFKTIGSRGVTVTNTEISDTVYIYETDHANIINVSSIETIDLRSSDSYRIESCSLREINIYYSDNGLFSNCTLNGTGDARIKFFTSHHNTFSNCTISGYSDGIESYSSSWNEFINCTISENSGGGIEIDGNGNKIMFCQISNNSYGVNIDGDSNIVSNCSIFNNSEDGIYLGGYGSIDNNRIENTTISGNEGYGIYLYGSGSGTLSVDSNVIIDCSIEASDYSGIYIRDGDHNLISNSTFYNNSAGVSLARSYKTEIIRCTSQDNYYGIVLGGDNSTVLFCNISYNIGDGIHISSKSNIIANNSFCVNTDYAIEMKHMEFIRAENNKIFHNSYFSNGYHSSQCDGGNGENRWDNGLEGNYWSDYNGTDSDGNGIGDTPYDIDGASGGKDRYPLMEPNGSRRKPKTWTVDDDNGTWADFDAIGEAIDNSCENDTIRVFAGAYNEDIQVIKTLTIIGNKSKDTLINGSGDGNVVFIYGNDQLFEGFSITGSGDEWNHSGIYLSNSSHSIIRGCELYGNRDGILLDKSEYNEIADVSCHNNTIGIAFTAQGGDNNTISNCTTHSNEDAGIHLYGNDNVFIDCRAENNTNGLFIDWSFRNEVSYCHFINNSGYGIRINDSTANNSLHHNVFVDNGNGSTSQAYDGNTGNLWDDRSEGNYWSDYNGADADVNGIGDTPYYLNGDGKARDRYPLMEPNGSRKGSKTWIVDDDGGIWADYTSIQDAINASSDGDTVQVYAGTYVGSLILNRTALSLIGNGSAITIIDGDSDKHVLNIANGSVEVRGLAIYNGDVGDNSGAVFIKSIKGVAVIDCSITGNGACGIYVYSCSNISIIGCQIQDHGLDGIRLRYSDNVVIADSFITETRDAVILGHSTNVTIFNCTFTILEYNGISLSDAWDVTIENCTINKTRNGDNYSLGISRTTRLFVTNCSMNESISIRGRQESHYSTHRFQNCTVIGAPLHYIANAQNVAVCGSAGQVIIVNCSNVSVSSIAISECAYAILIVYSDTIFLDDINLTSLRINGIEAMYTTNLTITNTTIYGISEFGHSNYQSRGICLLQCDMANIQNCTVSKADHAGLLTWNCDDLILTNSTFSYCEEGIALWSSYWDHEIREVSAYIKDILTEGNDYGLRMESYNGSELCCIEARDNEFGIYLCWVNATVVRDCVLVNNSDAGLTHMGTDNILEDVTSFRNSIGMHLCGFKDSVIRNCSVHDNVAEGIFLNDDCWHAFTHHGNVSVYHNEIYRNGNNSIRITGNSSWSAPHTIWNNNISINSGNASQAYDEGGNNWDNGSIGNYWSDYNGTDGNGDGIGDTPYEIDGSAGSEDRYPLMEPVTIDKEENKSPVATIDSIKPNPARKGENVSFLGHGSDVDGNVTLYVWRSSIDGVFHNATINKANSTNLSVGMHSIGFRVMDDDGAWSLEVFWSLVVNPKNTSNQVPTGEIVNVHPDPSRYGVNVTFIARGNDTDGHIVRYLWLSSIDGIFYNETSNIIIHGGLSGGNHTITLHVMDDGGAWSEGVNISLIVNRPPVLSVPSDQQEKEVNGTVVISGTTSDPDGTVVRVEVSIDNGSWHVANGTAEWTFEWDTTDVKDGMHSIRVRSYDGYHYSGITEFNLTVNNGGLVGDEGPEGHGQMTLYASLIVVICISAIIALFVLHRRRSR